MLPDFGLRRTLENEKRDNKYAEVLKAKASRFGCLTQQDQVRYLTNKN